MKKNTVEGLLNRRTGKGEQHEGRGGAAFMISGTIDETTGQFVQLGAPRNGVNRSALVGLAPVQLFPANARRGRYIIQNKGVFNLWISWDGDAASGSLTSMIIGPGQTYLGDDDALPISVVAETGTTGNIPVFAREW